MNEDKSSSLEEGLKEKLEERLFLVKNEYDKILAPPELEDRLRSALKPQRPRFRGLAAAIIALALIFSYSFDTLAYYGKILLGYDSIIQGHIGELNEEGAGQEINRSYRFSNGTEIFLDGIMFDENELVAFYRVISKDQPKSTLLMEIKGIRPMGYAASGAMGQIIDDNTQIWIHSFQAPSFYEKWISLRITMIAPGQSETGSISFSLDRNKAMKRMVKQDIQKDVTVAGYQVHFAALTASRLNTTTEGTVEPLSNTLVDPLEEHAGIQFDIVIDGKKYSTAYAGVSPATKMDFSSEALGLPSQFETLEIGNIRFVRTKIIDQSVQLTTADENLVISDDLVVYQVDEEEGDTLITIKSKGIPIMGLFFGDQQAEGLNQSLEHLPESEQAVERTYRFKGTGRDMKLMVKALNYTSYAEGSIPIRTVSD